MIRPDASDLPGEDAFRFIHVLVRDAAYRAIGKEARAELHRRVADGSRSAPAGAFPNSTRSSVTTSSRPPKLCST